MSHPPDSQDYLDDGLDADFHALADRLDAELAKATDPVNKVVERFHTADKKPYALPKPGLNSSQQLDRVVGSHWIPSMEDYELDQAAQEEWIPAAPAKVGTDHVLLEKDETHTYELPSRPLSSPAAAVDKESTPALKRPLISASGSKDTTAATINPDGSLKAFVRGPFPREVQPRVDVQGLSTRTVIKTCFRIGEALQVGITAQRPTLTAYQSDVLVELYGSVPPHFCLGAHNVDKKVHSPRLLLGASGQEAKFPAPGPF
jgi:hypothetical protein